MDNMLVYTFLYGGNRVGVAATSFEDAQSAVFGMIGKGNLNLTPIPYSEIGQNLKVMPPTAETIH